MSQEPSDANPKRVENNKNCYIISTFLGYFYQRGREGEKSDPPPPPSLGLPLPLSLPGFDLLPKLPYYTPANTKISWMSCAWCLEFRWWPPTPSTLPPPWRSARTSSVVQTFPWPQTCCSLSATEYIYLYNIYAWFNLHLGTFLYGRSKL